MILFADNRYSIRGWRTANSRVHRGWQESRGGGLPAASILASISRTHAGFGFTICFKCGGVCGKSRADFIVAWYSLGDHVFHLFFAVSPLFTPSLRRITIMMLVQLPAMDTVQGLSLTDSLPSLSSLSGPLTILSHLAKPSVLLTLLASLVILSSIRAALLFMRPLPQQKGSISLVQSVVLATDKVVVGGVISSGPSPTSSAVKGKQPEKSTIVVPSTTADKKTISWCWGLLKWDSLPGLPTNVRNRINGVSMSEEERGWQLQQRGRRPGPAFEHPRTFDIIPA